MDLDLEIWEITDIGHIFQRVPFPVSQITHLSLVNRSLFIANEFSGKASKTRMEWKGRDIKYKSTYVFSRHLISFNDALVFHRPCMGGIRKVSHHLWCFVAFVVGWVYAL